ncbi:hypothetical protein AJ78_04347 [Emergomyces pasteurianus Ep9510]|uniref:Uncharacterized protein n=1 Tax=Emergomyces pasteurianus Ep9510 TaxID=1447872 RepID=A0A1J9PG37_9EURO|nr:hypothetical protein AJ78_04347 [Emergomyces pasteurianus Ep9510]
MPEPKSIRVHPSQQRLHSLVPSLHPSRTVLTGNKDKYSKMQERHQFLEHLPPHTKVYKYSGFQHLEAAVSEEYKRFIHENKSPCVVFTDISQNEIEIHEEILPGRIDYSPTLQTLILYIPSLPHEEAAEAFGCRIAIQAEEMGILDALSLRGATRTKTTDRRKQADRSWAPFDIPGRSTQWPTVALEVAFAESRERVKQDMAWWLHQSAGDVRMAISIDIKRQSGNIYVTSWERGIQHPYPEINPIQEIKISRGKDGKPPTLTGNDLVIPFRQMMLRPPTHNAKDFIFTKGELLRIGRVIWRAMAHM